MLDLDKAIIKKETKLLSEEETEKGKEAKAQKKIREEERKERKREERKGMRGTRIKGGVLLFDNDEFEKVGREKRKRERKKRIMNTDGSPHNAAPKTR